MAGFLDSLKESILGKEVNIPICSLPRKKTLHVFYTYYEGKPRSHRLEFRKGKRPVFEIFLPRYGESIAQLCSAGEKQQYRKAGEKSVFSFCLRMALRLKAGKLVSSMEIFSCPKFEINTPFGKASSVDRYRSAYCQKGARESIILVFSCHSITSKKHGEGGKFEYHWFKLTLVEFKKLVRSLKSFIGSSEFDKVKEQEKLKQGIESQSTDVTFQSLLSTIRNED